MQHPAESLKIRDLKLLLQQHSIDSSTYFEKSELVDLVKQHNIDVDLWLRKRQESTATPTPTDTRPPYPGGGGGGNPKPAEWTQQNSRFANMSYYDILEIDPKVDQSQIRKAYYLKARQCHPDKNPDDPEAEAIFKAVSEAYSVLSDEEKRKTYDKFGKEGLMGGGIDPTAFFRTMFGGGIFVDTFGELNILELVTSTNTTKPSFEFQTEKLAHQLLIKLEPYVHGGLENFRTVIAMDLVPKIEAPGGPALLTLIGKIYIQKAKQYQGAYFGFEGFFSSIAEKGNFASHAVDAFRLLLKIQKEQERFEKAGEVDMVAQERMLSLGLNMVWAIGKIEIDRVVSAACEAVMTEKGVSSHLVKVRANGLRILGEMWVEAGEKLMENNKELPFKVEDLLNSGQKKS